MPDAELGAWRLIAGSLRRHKGAAVRLVCWSLVQALPALAIGWTVAAAAGSFLAGHTGTGLGWLGLLAAAGLAGACGTRQMYCSLGGIVEPFRDELVERIVGAALERSMDITRTPDTRAVAWLTHQTEIVRDAYAGLLIVSCTFACTIGSTLAGLFTLVPATLPYVLGPVAVSLVVLRLLLRPFAARQRAMVVGEEDVASSAATAVSGLRDVLACGAEAPVLSGLTVNVDRQAAATRSVTRAGAARVTCMAIGGWLPLLLLLLLLPKLVHAGVPAGRIIGAISYIGAGLRTTLTTLSQGLGAGIVRLTVTLDRIAEATAAQPAEPRPRRAARPGASTRPGVSRPGAVARPGALVLRKVRFGYDPDAVPVISDLSIDIPPGEHLAIVGPSGVGKSSLAALLAGILRPTEGEILLDGIPPAEYPAAALPRQRVFIPQESYVFAGTLADNLCYLRAADGPVPAAELDAAAEAIGLAPLVSRLGGYRAAITGASGGLSAGERQLVALTRGYLAGAPITILDEATCHLDPAAEQRAEAAFASRGSTLIVIAHRISSALRARRILVLDGNRAEIGDHATLLSHSPLYQDLFGYWTGAPTA